MLKKIALLSFGFFLSVFSVQADESLYKIIEKENLDAFSDMVILGYGVNDWDADGYTPLILASSLGKKNFVQFLLLNEAVVDKRASDGTIALHHAARGGYNDIIDMLYKNGSFINYPDFQGLTPLMYAVLGNHVDTVQKIIDLGADVNFISAKKQTALSIARRRKLYPIISLLEKKGAR